jgi:predicted RND superfamily exporter protein
MNIIEIIDRQRQSINENIKINSVYIQFGELIKELRKKTLTDSVVELINEGIKELNSSPLIGNALKKTIKQKQKKILKLVEKELKIVPKNYYRKLWLFIGMSAIGLPIGVAFGMSIGNMGLSAIGLPIGMAVGIAVGTGMDKKVAREGRQLDIEIKEFS